jgi:hypothetical protein
MSFAIEPKDSMAERSKHTWYVSVKPKKPLPGKRCHSRATETFANEADAKQFAKAKLVDTKNVSAGTLNPRLPKRAIAAAQILEWLQETDESERARMNRASPHCSD